MKATRLIFSLAIAFLFFNVFGAYAQQPRLATFHETAQIIVDQRFQNQTSTSITVLSTSIQEMRVPVTLDQKIRDTPHVSAVVITNEDQCVLGVVDNACVLINISREGFEGGISEAQSKGREIGDSLINDINDVFSLDAKFHSVFIHVEDTINRELETSGTISGRGTISAVYVVPKYDTSYLFDGLSTILIPDQIRNSGGFLDVAKKISEDPNSSVTFSIIPQDGTSLYQLQVSRDYTIENKISSISPLKLLGIEKLERSNYFSAGFFPLNSLIQVTILSDDAMKITAHGSNLVPTVEKDGEKLPSDLTKNGWLFDPEAGDRIVGKYLFGKTFEVGKNDLKLTIGNSSQLEPANNNLLYIVIGVAVAAAVGAAIYLKRAKIRA
ncbi:MAG: hypothetical protein ACREAF_01900 [Nitrosopumilaceae archaeon]